MLTKPTMQSMQNRMRSLPSQSTGLAAKIQEAYTASTTGSGRGSAKKVAATGPDAAEALVKAQFYPVLGKQVKLDDVLEAATEDPTLRLRMSAAMKKPYGFAGPFVLLEEKPFVAESLASDISPDAESIY